MTANSIHADACASAALRPPSADVSPSAAAGRLGIVSVLALLMMAWAAAGAPAASAADACPNASLRTGPGAHLPDCMAYEQVSPLDKNGNNIGLYITGQSSGPIVSTADGDRALYTAYAAFAGAAAASAPNGYVGSRGAGSWMTNPVTPPYNPNDDLVTGSYVLGGTPDFSKQLVSSDRALAPGGVENRANFYIYDVVSGSYEHVAAFPNLDNPSLIYSFFAGSSEDGDRMFFVGSNGNGGSDAAGNLPSTPQSNPDSEFNLYEYSNGELKLVGVLPDGTPSPTGSNAGPSIPQAQLARHAISDDGTRAYWTPFTGSFVPDPVYLRENDQTVVVSKRESDGTAQAAYFERATPDGDHAFISSSAAQLTDDAGLPENPNDFDLYRYDADSGDLTDLTPGPDGAGVENILGVSDDGEFVYFQAQEVLAPGGIDDQHNLYVWHDGNIRLIATSPDPIWTQNRRPLDDWRTSPDGGHFGFLFSGALAGANPYPAQPFKQAYLYDFEADTLVCASCPPAGGVPVAATRLHLPSEQSRLVHETETEGASRNVLDDGAYFFETRDALLSRDTNGRYDVYRYLDGDLDLISTGRDPEDSHFGDASEDGDDVFFLTYDRLVGQDRDSLTDLYVARVGGGLASQYPVPDPDCQDDACQGPPTAPPLLKDLGSVDFAGRGNVPASGAGSVSISISKLRPVIGSAARLRVRVPGAGRVSVTGSSVRKRSKSAARAQTVTIRVSLSSKARQTLKKKRKLSVRVRVAFSSRTGGSASKTVTVTFKQPKARKQTNRGGGK
ncbi:MAG TPA: hypothetical protein VLJ42_10670 [Solirubrobacteraceae bacterium]|nr:hypothetical protein [Solirubrobacteraceae bacterium]